MTRIYIQSINSTTSDHVCGYIILIFIHETGKSEIIFFVSVHFNIFKDPADVISFYRHQQILFRLILFLVRE